MNNLDDIQYNRAMGKYTGGHGTESRMLMAYHRLCLCWHCAEFTPENRETNCPIANALYALCVEHDIVTPVARCPMFVPKPEDE